MTRAVGRPVDRIDHHGDLRVGGSAPARLLAEHPETGRREHRQDGGVGHQIELVLAGPVGAGAPFDRTQDRQRAPLRGAGDVEEREQLIGVHRVGAHRRAGSTVTIAL